MSVDGNYLVVEGNRRVAALKYLQQKHEADGYDLGRLDPQVFANVPVVDYEDASEAHHLVLMGLKHISGNKKWSALNQAELVRDLHETHGMSMDDVSKSIGVSRQAVMIVLETLTLYEKYKASEYGEQANSNKYSIFIEVRKNRKVRSWLQWDKNSGVVNNPQNLDRLFSWMSEDSFPAESDEAEAELTGGGNVLAPIIEKAVQIRELGKIIDDEQALDKLEATRNLAEATLASDAVGKARVQTALSSIGEQTGHYVCLVKTCRRCRQRRDSKAGKKTGERG